MLSDCLVVRADIIVTVLPVRAPGNFMCGFESFCVSAEGSSQTAEICGKRSRVVSHKNKPTCQLPTQRRSVLYITQKMVVSSHFVANFVFCVN